MGAVPLPHIVKPHFSYLDDALIDEDLRNVKNLPKNSKKQQNVMHTYQSMQLETPEWQQQYSPEQRVKIK